MAETEPTLEATRAVIAGEMHREGPLLPILHALQAAFGHVPEAAVAMIAEALKICRAEACQAVGAVALAEAVLERLGTEWHGTNANGAVTVEPVYCLGLCANGPAAMIDGRPLAAATAEAIAAEVLA